MQMFHNKQPYIQVILNKQLFQKSLILVICLGMMLIMYPRKLGQTEFNKEAQRYHKKNTPSSFHTLQI